ncbi:bacteriocin [Propionivibrio sp.]|uniref:bacteriocin n=1 Tax=Propionivibrio sp. TaxID=2212460 RepID=UPI003BF30AC1
MSNDETKDSVKQKKQHIDNDPTLELTDEQLAKVSGGLKRMVRGGDDDLKDLEVER